LLWISAEYICATQSFGENGSKPCRGNGKVEQFQGLLRFAEERYFLNIFHNGRNSYTFDGHVEKTQYTPVDKPGFGGRRRGGTYFFEKPGHFRPFSRQKNFLLCPL